nr:RNA-directed DNA polymerase, eukaryota [Tanacetum cinerariifolium]
ESLINSLSNMWIGKMRLYDNIARFDRNLNGKPSHARVRVANHVHVSPKVISKADIASSYVNVTRGFTQSESKIPNSAHIDVGVPLIILSQDKPNDF